MVFLFQKAQNKDSRSIQLKLHELVAAHDRASNRLVGVEGMTTPEPLASEGLKKSKLYFVIQRHDASHLHYDFRLELEGVLKIFSS